MVTFSPQAISYGAALLAGLIGSTHCFAMCGGFAGALGLHMRGRLGTASHALAHACTTQVGRITSYAIAGALVAGVGAALQKLIDLARFTQVMRILAGFLLIAVAVRTTSSVNLFAGIERLGARLWAHLAPFAARATRARGFAAPFLVGAAWGWLPCGLVYSMLAYAAFSGSALQGATIMFAFGLGTVPAMVGGSLFAGQLLRAFKFRGARWVAATMLACFGVFSIVAVLPTLHQHH